MDCGPQDYNLMAEDLALLADSREPEGIRSRTVLPRWQPEPEHSRAARPSHARSPSRSLTPNGPNRVSACTNDSNSHVSWHVSKITCGVVRSGQHEVADIGKTGGEEELLLRGH